MLSLSPAAASTSNAITDADAPTNRTGVGNIDLTSFSVCSGIVTTFGNGVAPELFSNSLAALMNSGIGKIDIIASGVTSKSSSATFTTLSLPRKPT